MTLNKWGFCDYCFISCRTKEIIINEFIEYIKNKHITYNDIFIINLPDFIINLPDFIIKKYLFNEQNEPIQNYNSIHINENYTCINGRIGCIYCI